VILPGDTARRARRHGGRRFPDHEIRCARERKGLFDRVEDLDEVSPGAGAHDCGSRPFRHRRSGRGNRRSARRSPKRRSARVSGSDGFARARNCAIRSAALACQHQVRFRRGGRRAPPAAARSFAERQQKDHARSRLLTVASATGKPSRAKGRARPDGCGRPPTPSRARRKVVAGGPAPGPIRSSGHRS